MGLGESSSTLFLNVGYGRLRKKCKAETPGAVERKTKDGESTWALEYRYVEGILDSVFPREHEEFGRSWVVRILDGKESYSIQISEDSRYANDFLKRLPNLRKNQVIKIMPYDFTDDKGKRKVGLKITGPGEERIENYYQEFIQEGDKFSVINKHGYPEYGGDRKDKDELKIYFIKVTKFLREQSIHFIENQFQEISDTQREEFQEGPPEDDLPF